MDIISSMFPTYRDQWSAYNQFVQNEQARKDASHALRNQLIGAAGTLAGAGLVKSALNTGNDKPSLLSQALSAFDSSGNGNAGGTGVMDASQALTSPYNPSIGDWPGASSGVANALNNWGMGSSMFSSPDSNGISSANGTSDPNTGTQDLAATTNAGTSAGNASVQPTSDGSAVTSAETSAGDGSWYTPVTDFFSNIGSWF